jgi:hypothetical protein
MYLDYIKDKSEDSKYYVTAKQFDNMCKDFYTAIMNYILEEAGTFEMPHRIGEVRIIKRKRKFTRKESLAIDWKLTQEYGKYIYLLNEHSKGYRYSFMWHKYNDAFKNKFLYRLVMIRQNKRKLAKMIKSGDYDYMEIK